MQRLRIRFSRGEALKYITHLDLMRLWERALRRAGIPLAYSTGFSPHPRISLGAPLAIGVTSEAELVDVFLTRRVSPYFFIQSTSKQLPPGIDILEAQEVSLGLPSLQSQLRYVQYYVKIETSNKLAEVQSALRSLLQADHLPWQHMRDTGPRRYDLRLLIDDLWLMDWSDSWCTLGMRLRIDSRGTGRPEQVCKALGFTSYPSSIHRTKLILTERESRR